ncbi:hypothetical protein KP509_18G013300 [Ceratopteris richardii]|uniref:Pentatricopeptide repeat-containing protein n=1 Tax=Ceratopteris richardii TaxID=49495 RepID=A0A8T2SPA1_CERRI|nr:hypothetical protein KP509_18G013300 [Ceratopteris richardii]
MFPQASVETLQYIIFSYTKVRHISLAVSVHFYLRNTGLHAHSSLGNLYPSTLIDVGSVSDAVKGSRIFPEKKSAQWEYLINGYLKCGKERPAFTLFQLMHEECTVHLSSHTSVALLQACTKLREVKIGELVHDQLGALLQTDVHVAKALVDMYARCGFLQRAQEVFDAIPFVNVIIWNALIGGYVYNDKSRYALKLFDEMQYKHVSPNAVTYVLILKACGAAGAREQGVRIHRLVEKQNFLTNRHVCSALINMYAECGSLEQAQDVLQMLSLRDVASWNALIGGYSKHGQGEEALNLYDQMKLKGLSPNAITYACIVKACGNIGSIEKANEIHSEIEKRGLHKRNIIVGSGLVDMFVKCGSLTKAHEVFELLPMKNVVTWNALIAGYAHGKHGEKALSLFEQMKSEGIKPSPVTYACSLIACGSAGAADKGIGIHEEVKSKGLLEKNLFVGSALVDMYVKCGLLDKAQDLFDVLPMRNVVTWCALITGYTQLGRVEIAVFNFERMVAEGIVPDQVVLVSILNACSHSGSLQIGQTYFEAISEDYGIPVCLTHHSCLVDLFGRAGQMEIALEILSNTPFHPNLVTWICVLSACRKWGHLQLGTQIFGQALCLDEVDSIYVCMHNIYATTWLQSGENI